MRWLGAIVLATTLAAGSLAANDLTAHEEELRAAYVYNLAKFVEWPATAMGKPGTPLVIGVLGDENFARILKTALVGKQAQGRPLAVRRFGSASELEPTHILFVGSGEENLPGRALQRIGRAPVLLVGEHESFIRSGGIINFYIEEETLRFEICAERAERLGLKISSKLLRLARVVRER